MHARILLSTLVISTAISYASESFSAYVCIAEMATGFAYENGKWHPKEFDVGESRFLIRRSKSDDIHSDHPWVWGRMHDNDMVGWCEKEPNDVGFLFCKGIDGNLKFNVQSLLFERYDHAGYVTASGNPINWDRGGPSIEIGKCEVHDEP